MDINWAASAREIGYAIVGFAGGIVVGTCLGCGIERAKEWWKNKFSGPSTDPFKDIDHVKLPNRETWPQMWADIKAKKALEDSEPRVSG